MKSSFSQERAQATFLTIILVTSMVALSFGLQSSTIVPSNGSIYYPPEALALFNDGFESGNFNAWNGTQTTSSDQAVIASTLPYDGVYHARFQTNSITSGTKYAFSYVTITPAISEVYARAYFYIADGLPLNDNEDRFGLVGFEVGGQLQCTFRVYRSGGTDRFNIVGLNGAGTVQKSTDAIYPTEGQWFCIEFYIKIHNTEGEYRAWINGVEQLTLTNLDTTHYGTNVSLVRIGFTATINVQHPINLYCDAVVLSTRYIGQFYTFGVIGSTVDNPAINNFCWLFGNQSIRYRMLLPSQVTSSASIDLFDGLVVWTKQGGYNAEAVKKFAETRIVLSHIYDFCANLYPSLSTSTQIVSIATVTYTTDWGPFHNGDLVEMRNETGNINKLTTVLASALSSFTNTSTIARYDSSHIALFHMNGERSNSGFYVMDFDATTPQTQWTGIWHTFPAIKMVKDFPTGKYTTWMANGQNWWDLTWIYNEINTIVTENSDIAKKQIIGYSVQNREIPAIFIGNGTRYAIIDGSIHGCEKTGTFACLRIAKLLTDYYHSDPNWTSRLTQYTIIIIPVLNPDGFALNTRQNANGVDLNRQFPPDGTTTQPEAWALRNLMGNYTPTVYVNMHEGAAYYPLHMIYGAYETGTNRSITINTMQQANQTFVSLKHWGWYTEQNLHVWVGKVATIVAGGGAPGMAADYASYAYGASCMLLETFLWSQTYKARQCLWGLDYYPAVILSFIQQIPR